MDRRKFLQGSMAAALSAAMPATAVAQSSASARPAFPPVDARSVWLVGDDASAITGALIPIDAGHLVLPGYRDSSGSR